MATAGNTVHKIQKFSYTDANNTTVYNSDVKVQGNLTVVGSSVYAQSEVVLVKDNIITLNAAIGQSDTPLFNAGIEVDRGNQPNVSFIWNESSQAWQFTNNGTTYESLGGGSSGVYANAAFIQANAAFAVANTGSADVFARTQANASFIQANAAFNAANNASDTWVRNQANIAYTHANAAYAFANASTAWGTRQAFVATAGQTVFSPGSGYLPGSIDVYYNGLKLYGAEDYTATDGINVTLTNPATVNSIIEIVGFGANSVAANVYVLNSMNSMLQRQTFFATAGQTTFTVTGGYRIGYIDVYYNGLKINIPEDVTANNGSTINFVGLTPALNDIIEVVGLTPNVALANAIPITGGTISGGLTLAGNVNPVTDNTYYLGSATNRWHSLFVGPGSVDIGGLKLSNVGGTLSVASPGQPATPIAGEDTWVRTQANASFLQANAAFSSANNVAPQIEPAFNAANSASLYANAAFNAANNASDSWVRNQANLAFDKANTGAQYGANTSSNSFFAVPIGTTEERPANAANGAIRYNTTTGSLETYLYIAGWQTIIADTYTVEYLAVAGGGGAGISNGAAGAGAGGLLNGSFSATSRTGYSITVGSGGAASTTASVKGSNGTNSIIASVVTTLGGGGSGSEQNNPTNTGNSGGSGGGGVRQYGGGAGTPGQGYPGGANVNDGSPHYGGGGGGGAGAAGTNGSASGSGNGGIGLQFSAWATATSTGDSGYYAGGGAGGSYDQAGAGGQGGTRGIGGGGPGGTNYTAAQLSGYTNTGGGGGGKGNVTAVGGAGGSGIVILRYLGSQRGTGGTITSSGGYTYHTFTGSGTFTA